MEKLTIKIDGVDKKIGFTDRLTKGIFQAIDNNMVKKNCEVLSIDLKPTDNELEQVIRVSKLGKVGIVSSVLLNHYFQYIIMASAERADLEDLLKELPQNLHEPLRHAFNLRQMDTLNDLDFLGGPLDNKN